MENAEYSRVGMLVKWTNPYTERIEVYLLELTRNVDRFMDAFRCVWWWSLRCVEVEIYGLDRDRLNSG